MNIFSLKIRIGRLSYFVWMLCLGIGYSFLKTILNNNIGFFYISEYNGTVVFCVIGIISLILLSSVPVCQRLHDLNMSGKWDIIWTLFACARILSIFGSYELNYIIHILTFPISLIFGIVLLFSPGSDKENKYGIRKHKTIQNNRSLKQKDKKQKHRILIPIIGIVLGICSLVSLFFGVGIISDSRERHYTGRRIVREEYEYSWDTDKMFAGIGLVFLSSLMIYGLARTKFGVKNHLEDDINKVDHEIKKAQLLNENCRLKKELDKLC